MKSLQNQYNAIQEGKGQKDVFLKSVKRLFPDMIPNHFGFNETTNILKQRGVISEMVIGRGIAQPKDNPFKNFDKFLSEEVKAEEKKVSKEVTDVQKHAYDSADKKISDNVFGEAFLEGYYAEMKDPKNADKTVDQLKEIVAKNLAKDPTYYVTNQAFGIKGIGYETEVPGLGTPKEAKGKYKSSGYGDLKESILAIAKEINDEAGSN